MDKTLIRLIHFLFYIWLAFNIYKIGYNLYIISDSYNSSISQVLYQHTDIKPTPIKIEKKAIETAREQIKTYIRYINPKDKNKYIEAVERIKIVGLSDDKFGDKTSLAFYTKKFDEDIIFYNVDLFYDNFGPRFMSTIRHELLHKIDEDGFFKDLDKSNLDIYNISNNENEEKVLEYMNNIFNGYFSDEHIRQMCGIINPNGIKYYTSRNETIVRIINLKIYLHINCLVDMKEPLTFESIKLAFIHSMVSDNSELVEYDFYATFLLLDICNGKQETINKINNIVKTK